MKLNLSRLISFVNSTKYGLLTLSILLMIGCSNTVNSSTDDTFPDCFVGTYLVVQGGGTQSLWTFGKRGTLILNSSDQEALNFSTEQGVWKQSGTGTATTLSLDFSFGDNGEFVNIARVDATVNFLGSECTDIEGEFSLRFFLPGQAPLNLESHSGDVITDTFTGSKIIID